MSVPKFSVVIPAFNAASTLGDTLDSLLSQTYSSWEAILVDDGSNDGTAALAARYASLDARIRTFSQKNAGTGAAIAAGIRDSRGEFVVQLGADDMLLSEYMTRTDEFIVANPAFDIYASNAYRLYPDGTRTLYHSAPRFSSIFSLTLDDLLDESQIFGTAAFRREWFDRVGGFRHEIYNEDYDFWLRIMAHGATHIYQPIPLALYRVTPGQKTEESVAVRRDDIRILNDLIDSGTLTQEQIEHARRSIALLEKNIAFRTRAEALLGPKLARPLFALAHKVAWLVRPYRRK